MTKSLKLLKTSLVQSAISLEDLKDSIVKEEGGSSIPVQAARGQRRWQSSDTTKRWVGKRKAVTQQEDPDGSNRFIKAAQQLRSAWTFQNTDMYYITRRKNPDANAKALQALISQSVYAVRNTLHSIQERHGPPPPDLHQICLDAANHAYKAVEAQLTNCQGESGGSEHNATLDTDNDSDNAASGQSTEANPGSVISYHMATDRAGEGGKNRFILWDEMLPQVVIDPFSKATAKWYELSMKAQDSEPGLLQTAESQEIIDQYLNASADFLESGGRTTEMSRMQREIYQKTHKKHYGEVQILLSSIGEHEGSEARA